ncbi:hypothetical protein FRC98_08680 [Lujinxingia vulgaris]|uniref:Uncharacterized protein n=1 Tax=Lujinxingia vulgaris TaxID=2600176 RepID=A0A5C6XI03_9DELT|nr:hypothetical protein [Lujinxingia vulgaris]TXD37752.1 hypothetical protein FRC98_08680 [Lujinxingia vulgaris]
MLSDQIIYDELKRQREHDTSWQPEALRLPLYIPRHDDTRDEHDEDEAEETSRGVVIIDMNDGYSIVT